jgi:hypothetical protein
VSADRGPKRLPYAIAGAAMRDAIRAATNAGCTGLQRRVLDAVFVFTATYSRRTDRVAVVELARWVYGRDRVNGWGRKRVGEALRSLAELGIVVYEPGIGASAMATIGLPEYTPDQGAFMFKERTPDQGALESECTPIQSLMDPDPGPLDAPRAGHTEKTARSTSTEKRTRVDVATTPTRAPARRARARDPIFDALIECWKLDPAELTKTERGRLNKAAKELRDIGADPADISRRRDVYRLRYPNAADTPLAVVSRWAELAHIDTGGLPTMPPGTEWSLKWLEAHERDEASRDGP